MLMPNQWTKCCEQNPLALSSPGVFINVTVIFVISAIMSSHGDATRRDGRFTLFYARNAFSQHSRCTFVVDDHRFHSALHYMLYEKASEYIPQDL